MADELVNFLIMDVVEQKVHSYPKAVAEIELENEL